MQALSQDLTLVRGIWISPWAQPCTLPLPPQVRIWWVSTFPFTGTKNVTFCAAEKWGPPHWMTNSVYNSETSEAPLLLQGNATSLGGPEAFLEWPLSSWPLHHTLILIWSLSLFSNPFPYFMTLNASLCLLTLSLLILSVQTSGPWGSLSNFWAPFPILPFPVCSFRICPDTPPTQDWFFYPSYKHLWDPHPTTAPTLCPSCFSCWSRHSFCAGSEQGPRGSRWDLKESRDIRCPPISPTYYDLWKEGTLCQSSLLIERQLGIIPLHKEQTAQPLSLWTGARKESRIFWISSKKTQFCALVLQVPFLFLFAF